MVNSLRKVDFSHPTGHYAWKKIRPSPPLRKSWVRSCKPSFITGDSSAEVPSCGNGSRSMIDGQWSIFSGQWSMVSG